MILTLENGRRFDTSRPVDISIPLRFNGPQPNAYGVEPASAEACEYGSLVGDTRRGGSCNFERYTFIPHCSGTHTECVGHITNERISVRDCLRDAVVPTVVVTVEPERAERVSEAYSVEFAKGDRLITARVLKAALSARSAHGDHALIVRTLPNEETKLTATYDQNNIPPYFTGDAVRHLADHGCRHLLVDLPSIDRLFDEGKLLNHRIFWGVAEGSFDAGPATRKDRTVTELIYVPDEVPDGEYLLNLQIAPFASDCAPSRPLLFPLAGSR